MKKQGGEITKMSGNINFRNSDRRSVFKFQLNSGGRERGERLSPSRLFPAGEKY